MEKYSKEWWKEWWKYAKIRAIKTIAQNLVSTLPVGIVVSPVMVQEANWEIIYIILAWLLTGLLGGIASLLTSLAGLPELEEK